MRLTQKEIDRLSVFTLAELARRRRARGRKLNVTESLAVICDEVFERAWDGSTIGEVIAAARSVLTRDDVMDGVPEILQTVEVDALFPSGTGLVVVPSPIQGETRGDQPDRPGAVWTSNGAIRINDGRPVVEVEVENTSDRPIQVTSHFHFLEVNRHLRFDRRLGLGMRLDIMAGAAERWEPGQRKTVRLVPIGGHGHAWGFNGLVNGPVADIDRDEAARVASAAGFEHEEAPTRGSGD